MPPRRSARKSKGVDNRPKDNPNNPFSSILKSRATGVTKASNKVSKKAKIVSLPANEVVPEVELGEELGVELEAESVSELAEQPVDQDHEPPQSDPFAYDPIDISSPALPPNTLSITEVAPLVPLNVTVFLRTYIDDVHIEPLEADIWSAWESWRWNDMMAESRRKAERHLGLTPLEETRGSNVLREPSIRIASYGPKLQITRIMTTRSCYKKLGDLLCANKWKKISLSINWGWAKPPHTNLIPVQSSVKALATPGPSAKKIQKDKKVTDIESNETMMASEMATHKSSATSQLRLQLEQEKQSESGQMAEIIRAISDYWECLDPDCEWAKGSCWIKPNKGHLELNNKCVLLWAKSVRKYGQLPPSNPKCCKVNQPNFDVQAQIVLFDNEKKEKAKALKAKAKKSNAEEKGVPEPQKIIAAEPLHPSAFVAPPWANWGQFGAPNPWAYGPSQPVWNSYFQAQLSKQEEPPKQSVFQDIVDRTRSSPVSVSLSIPQQPDGFKVWCLDHLPANKIEPLGKVFACFHRQYWDLDDISSLSTIEQDENHLPRGVVKLVQNQVSPYKKELKKREILEEQDAVRARQIELKEHEDGLAASALLSLNNRAIQRAVVEDENDEFDAFSSQIGGGEELEGELI